jgi:hypothetical protein
MRPKTWHSASDQPRFQAQTVTEVSSIPTATWGLGKAVFSSRPNSYTLLLGEFSSDVGEPDGVVDEPEVDVPIELEELELKPLLLGVAPKEELLPYPP